jgi:predicted GNAT superfamily acetyltransferase
MDTMTDIRDELSIRRIHKGDKSFPEMQKLMEDTWSRESLIPEHLTLTLMKNGGLVIGAFLGDRLVAFSYGFPGFDGTSSYLCSHMLAVAPELRKHRIGERMKWAQRTEALQMGYSKMVWTYDPLESVNAYFNMTKLGAVCRTYIDDCYGDMDDDLNRGLPSDRFWVEWNLLDSKVEALSRGESRNLLPFETFNALAVAGNEGDVLKLGDIPYELLDRTDRVWVPLPSSFQQMKQGNRTLALEWRMKYREIFHLLFEKGFVANGVLRASSSNGLLNYYLVERRGSIHEN